MLTLSRLFWFNKGRFFYIHEDIRKDLISLQAILAVLLPPAVSIYGGQAFPINLGNAVTLPALVDFRPTLDAPQISHMSQFNSSLAECPGKVEAGGTGLVADELEDDITEAVEYRAYRAVEEADVTGAVKLEPEADTEAVDEEIAVEAESAVLARAAWCLAARWRFFSLSAGPRCRGRRGGEEEGGGGAGAGGREWGAPGLPIVLLMPTQSM